mmetsp:Transcript_24542/g.68409  ORF Transcript_24542/g.68409 Transcript_24542/m.68409 type:complete len:320 (-) Transcript_24542:126-1085(-)
MPAAPCRVIIRSCRIGIKHINQHIKHSNILIASTNGDLPGRAELLGVLLDQRDSLVLQLLVDSEEPQTFVEREQRRDGDGAAQRLHQGWLGTLEDAVSEVDLDVPRKHMQGEGVREDAARAVPGHGRCHLLVRLLGQRMGGRALVVLVEVLGRRVHGIQERGVHERTEGVDGEVVHEVESAARQIPREGGMLRADHGQRQEREEDERGVDDAGHSEEVDELIPGIRVVDSVEGQGALDVVELGDGLQHVHEHERGEDLRRGEGRQQRAIVAGGDAGGRLGGRGGAGACLAHGALLEVSLMVFVAGWTSSTIQVVDDSGC